MIDYVKSNLSFIAILIVWLLVGVYAAPLSYGLIPLTVLVFKRRDYYAEIIIGFFFILMISDSRVKSFAFAVDVKNIYILLLAAFVLFDSKNFKPFQNFYQKYIPFFLVALFCLVYSPYAGTSFSKLLSYFLIILVVPNFVHKAYSVKGVQFFRELIFFGSTMLLIGLVLKYIAHDVAYLSDRFRGTLGNPNGLGIFLLMFFLLFSVISEYFKNLFTVNEKRIIYFLIFSSLILSASRSALTAILIFAIFRYLYNISPFVGFIIFIIFLFGYQLITSNIVPIVMALGLQDYFRLDTLTEGSGRLIAWTFAWEQIQYNFFLGRGFGYTEWIFGQYYEILSRKGHQGHAHNTFLTFWLDTGLVGLVFYVQAFILQFVQAAKRSRSAIPAMYAVLFSVFFESWLTASLNPYTIQLIIILTVFTTFNPMEVAPQGEPIKIKSNE